MAVDILSSLNTNGSGLSIKTLTSQLVEAEIAPLTDIQQTKIETAQTSISAIGQIRSQFESLKSAITALGTSPILKATSSNSGVAVTVTDPAKVANSVHSLGVTQLAKRQVMEFKGFTSADATVGAGQLQIEIGAWFDDETTGTRTFAINPDTTVNTLTIPSGATLEMLAETLDGLDGVSAAVIDKGDGTFSLGVVSDSGGGHALRMTASETVAGLSTFDTNTTIEDVEVQAAQDAVLTIDGITVTRSSNTVDDLIDGVTLDITATEGSTSTLTFKRDQDTAQQNLEFMLEQVNATRKMLNDLSARSVNGTTAGALAGDRMAETLKSQLSALISAPITGFGSKAKYLSDFGVTTQRDGTLKLNSYNFETAFAADPTAFDAAFSNRLTIGSINSEVTGVVADTVKAGNYSFKRDATTGVATFDGAPTLATTLEDGRTQYIVLGGDMSGLMITVPDDVTETDVTFGRSFLSTLESFMSESLSSTGIIDERESQIGDRITEAQDEITALESRSTTLEKRYLTRFTAMEKAITSLKSTGQYLTNLVDSWNKDG